MQRIKKERNKQIIQRIKKGDYQIDIARDFNISEARVSIIKKKYLGTVEKTFDKGLRI